LKEEKKGTVMEKPSVVLLVKENRFGFELGGENSSPTT